MVEVEGDRLLFSPNKILKFSVNNRPILKGGLRHPPTLLSNAPASHMVRKKSEGYARGRS